MAILNHSFSRTERCVPHPRLAHRTRRNPLYESVVHACLVCGVFLAMGAASPKPQPKEYELKAAYLYNFALFVEWPASAFAQPRSPFVIGILGADPFGDDLDTVIGDEKANGRPVQIVRFRRHIDVKDCHVLFISSSEKDDMREIIRTFAEQPVLTVGETDDFVAQGGCIQWTREGRKIRITVNSEATRRADLKVKSDLLSIARVVAPTTEAR